MAPSKRALRAAKKQKVNTTGTENASKASVDSTEASTSHAQVDESGELDSASKKVMDRHQPTSNQHEQLYPAEQDMIKNITDALDTSIQDISGASSIQTLAWIPRKSTTALKTIWPTLANYFSAHRALFLEALVGHIVENHSKHDPEEDGGGEFDLNRHRRAVQTLLYLASEDYKSVSGYCVDGEVMDKTVAAILNKTGMACRRRLAGSCTLICSV